MKTQQPSSYSGWNLDEEQRYSLKLFVSGASPNSMRAIANLKSICEKYIGANCDLEIIDVYQLPARAKTEQAIALPMLVKYSPLPLKRLFGDMSDTHKVLKGLGINK
jgi:circadian clock protein KaiB